LITICSVLAIVGTVWAFLPKSMIGADWVDWCKQGRDGKRLWERSDPVDGTVCCILALNICIWHSGSRRMASTEYILNSKCLWASLLSSSSKIFFLKRLSSSYKRSIALYRVEPHMQSLSWVESSCDYRDEYT
jgi:hypothetical protein